MKRTIVIVTMLAVLAGIAASALAARRQPPRRQPRPELPQPKAALDTLFFDNFETDTMGWDTMDVLVRPPYWHIDDYHAYDGHSWWCGKYDPNYTISPGYGNAWVQFLYSPDFDLAAITADSVILSFQQSYNVEGPSGGSDWDCVNLWGSTDSGRTWFILYPDISRGTPPYNLSNATAWHYDGLAPIDVQIPGWGGDAGGWSLAQFDLTPYKGQALRLRFSMLSDGAASQEDGQIPGNGAWYLDNIRVDTVSAGGSTDTIFYDDVESGNRGWTASGKIPAIHWHRSAYRSNSPVTSWYSGDSLSHLQSWGYTDALVSPPIDLREVKTTTPCTGKFMTWVSLPDSYSTYTRGWDYYEVEVSDDSGQSWTSVAQYDQATPQESWVASPTFNLLPYAGKVVRVRITMNTDEYRTVREGVYIDDFTVTGKGRDPLPGASTVLLMDNDGEAVDISDNSWTKYFEASLAAAGYRYNTAAVGYNRQMLPGYLEQFPAVVWNLGANAQPVNVNDMASMLSYLDHGGRLWISGQYYLASGPDTTVHPNLWTDYLHLLANNGWWPTYTAAVTGVAGDALSDGFLEIMAYDPLNGGGSYWTDAFHAMGLAPDSAVLPNWTAFVKNDDSSCCGLRYWDGTPGGYRLIYTAFPFEAITASDHRDTLLARALNWLLPVQPGYTVPAQPTGLQAAQDYDSVICRWHANSEPAVAGYEIYRALQTGLPVWEKIGTVAAPETTFADTTVQPNAIYYYSVLAFDTSVPRNQSGRSPWIFLHAVPWTKMGSEGAPFPGTPREYALGQSHPNPVNDHATIQFALPSPSAVRLAVYNIAGQKVRTLANGSLPAGYHHVTWDGRGDAGSRLGNGVYFYRLDAVGSDGRTFSQNKRLMLVK